MRRIGVTNIRRIRSGMFTVQCRVHVFEHVAGYMCGIPICTPPRPRSRRLAWRDLGRRAGGTMGAASAAPPKPQPVCHPTRLSPNPSPNSSPNASPNSLRKLGAMGGGGRAYSLDMHQHMHVCSRSSVRCSEHRLSVFRTRWTIVGPRCRSMATTCGDHVWRMCQVTVKHAGSAQRSETRRSGAVLLHQRSRCSALRFCSRQLSVFVLTPAALCACALSPPFVKRATSDQSL